MFSRLPVTPRIICIQGLCQEIFLVYGKSFGLLAGNVILKNQILELFKVFDNVIILLGDYSRLM